MSLSTDQKAYLNNLATRGDLMAKSILLSMGNGSTTGIQNLFLILDVAAKSDVDVVTAKAANLASNSLALVASAAAKLLTRPRNVRAIFAAAWDGGNIVVTGTDQFNKAQTETLTANPGNTVVGVKVWKTITSVAKTAVGATANTVSVGTGDKLALTITLANQFAVALSRATNSDPYTAETITVDTATSAFTPTNLPDGARDYQVLAHVLTTG